MTIQFKYLYRFCGYFDLDWQNIFHNSQEVVEFFHLTSDPANERGLIADINQFLGKFQSEADIHRILSHYGFCYRVSYENKTYRQWLTDIKTQIEQRHSPKSPTNLSGIAGNASDDRPRRQLTSEQSRTYFRRKHKPISSGNGCAMVFFGVLLLALIVLGLYEMITKDLPWPFRGR